MDTPIDYDNLIAIGSMMGSGGLIVMDEDNCMVDIAQFFLDFTVDESCGKCTALPHRHPAECWRSSKSIIDGKGEDGDIEKLEELGREHQGRPRSAASVRRLPTPSCPPCAISATSMRRISSTRSAARRAHCQALLSYRSIPTKCKGCGSVLRESAPSGAISGESQSSRLHYRHSKCIKCGACMEKCTFQRDFQ